MAKKNVTGENPTEKNLTELFVGWSALFMQATMQEFNRFARAGGISMLQLTVLTALYYQGPHEVTAFAEIMQISPAGASQMVERLVQEGLVTRRPAAADRRVREVHLTQKGRTLVEESTVARDLWLAQIADNIPTHKRMLVVEALEVLSSVTAAINGEAGAAPE